MILRAKHLVCDTKRKFDDGAVRISGRKITFAGKASAIQPSGAETVLDFGDAVIAPGFINAHTHLAFRNKIPYEENFADWLQRAGRARKALSAEEHSKALETGLAEAIAAGTTAIASTELPPDCPIRGYEFVETICFDRDNAGKVIDELKSSLAAIDARGVRGGIAPHAPFTVTKEILEACAALAGKEERMLSIHAAESAMETAFLQGHRNELYEMLCSAGANLDEWEPPNTTPIRYLAGLGVTGKRTLLVHCNYVTTEEADIISRSGSSVVYCPRSSEFLGHVDHPFMHLVEKGVNVALGTDSLASSDSLSMLDEVRFLARKFPGKPPGTFWQLATANGAAALGLKNRTGRLKEGMDADIAVIAVSGCSGRDVFDLVVADESRVVAAFSAGTAVCDADGIIAELQGKRNA
ncbi:MAG: amidohydrolase family protein [Planctomycetota bacterium]